MEQGSVLAFARRFAEEGYYVFPMYSSSKGPQKPYGWARNEVGDRPPEKVIPASDKPEVVDSWPDLIEAGYPGQTLVGYGVMGLRCVIFDLDLKDGKDGNAEFKKIQQIYDVPTPEFVVKSKSGGFHLYYAKPPIFANLAIKTVAGLTLSGTKYPGLDLRGDGGMVVGPTYEGPESTWEPGRYQIIKGSPKTILSTAPTQLINMLGKSGLMNEQEVMTPINRETTDEMEILKRGEIPTVLSAGNRNTGFYIYLNALRNKGFTVETARKYVAELIKVTENSDDLAESVDIEDMLQRIWKIDLNNPYDVCRDLIDNGLFRLTYYRNKLMYVILNENPYIQSRTPHDITSIKQLMAGYARKVANGEGKIRVVNPADMIDAAITPDKEVATIGFKPGASDVFTLTEAEGGKRYLNIWNDPRSAIKYKTVDTEIWDKFKFLVSRIFGPEGTPEYQLGLDYPAWLLQQPGIKPVIAPYIMSRVRGAGKSVYLSVLNQIFGYTKTGELQARTFKVEEIGGRFFNPNGSSLLIFDEVQFPVHRNMRQESANFWRHMKAMVTGEIGSVEYKGGDTVQMPNFAGIILAGNTGSNFPMEEFDRRIWLIDNDPPEMDEGLIDEFYDMSKNKMPRERKREIINSLLMSLNDHKIVHQLDRIRAPMNEIKHEMYLTTLSDIEEFWLTYFEDRDNILANTPILNKSAILYLIGISERLSNSRWREDPENTFRELKRRGMVHPIRTQGNNYQTRNIRSVPIVRTDGTVAQEGEGRDVLYTTRQHGEFNNNSNESVMQMFFANINQIKKWKKEQVTAGRTKIADQL